MDIIFGEIKIYLPKTIEAISTAKGLLGLVEDEIVSSWVCKHCGCTENMPCPGGCSWVAPNVCSRCAENNAPEVPEPEMQGSDTTVCPKPAGVTSQSSSTEPEPPHSQSGELHGSNPIAGIFDETKLGTPGNSSIVRPSDLKISKFEFDESKMQSYKNIFFQEFPDGTVVLEYDKSHYYTTKENVLKIRYPFPKKYFSKENGWSSSIEIAFKKYRQYLAEQPQPERQQVEKEKPAAQQNVEDPDDWKFKPFLKTNTRTDYDGGKIEGTLEG